jgi:hypothetical protein
MEHCEEEVYEMEFYNWVQAKKDAYIQEVYDEKFEYFESCIQTVADHLNRNPEDFSHALHKFDNIDRLDKRWKVEFPPPLKTALEVLLKVSNACFAFFLGLLCSLCVWGNQTGGSCEYVVHPTHTPFSPSPPCKAITTTDGFNYETLTGEVDVALALLVT